MASDSYFKFLKKEGIPGIYDIDTRALTKKIRECGVMNGMLTLTPPATDMDNNQSAGVISELTDFKIKAAVSSVSCKEKYEVIPGLPKYNVVLWDFGAKQNIIRKLHSLGCKVTVVPYNTTCEDIIKLNPDGIMLSNGPGDPKENTAIIRELKKLFIYQLPTFGICLGHQLLALANGADTEKLKYGHRGANQPVKDLSTGRIYITSQNHGYAVKSDSLPSNAALSFINMNDRTCEGLTYNNIPAFSVQFHPEACGGPHDTEYLFNRFIELMQRRSK